MLARVLPHPLLSLALTIVWLMLANDISRGGLVMGVILGVAIPLMTRAYWPDRPRIRRPVRMLAYVLLVLWDVAVANIVVALIVLVKPVSRIRPAFVTIPLDLRTPEAITMLAGTITMTPGTVTAELSADGRSLLVHALDAPDPDAVRDEIKSRYEARLKEIFE
jgi:multicomponent K+:H+ antiporter subunit E